MVKLLVVVLVSLAACGCGTAPKIAVNAGVLKSGQPVAYFEQSDRIPKEILLAANEDATTPVASALVAIPPEVIGEVIDKLLEIIPEVTKGYGEERMHNALLGRRMLFIGYESPEQLEKIKEIVDSMGGAIEYVTPQTLPGAGMRAVGQPVAPPK
jgi:hypothetical protein